MKKSIIKIIFIVQLVDSFLIAVMNLFLPVNCTFFSTLKGNRKKTKLKLKDVNILKLITIVSISAELGGGVFGANGEWWCWWCLVNLQLTL